MFLCQKRIAKDGTILKIKEDKANDKMKRLAMSSAQDPIKMHLDDTLEPKLDKLLAKKVKTTAF